MTGRRHAKWIGSLRKAANAGKKAILANYKEDERRTVIGKGVGGDMTLKIDKASEDAIYSSLVRDLGRDEFVFVSEEIGEKPTEDDDGKPVVICDPLDGSHNAQIGLPLFAVSISVLGLDGKLGHETSRRFRDIDQSVILSVMTPDEFSASRNGGATQNRRRIKPDVIGETNHQERIETLHIECSDIDYYKGLLHRLTSRNVYKARLLGSAALGFAYLANGTTKGFIFASPEGARTIDSPAGYLIATEAGRVLTDLSGKMENLSSVEVGFHSRQNILGAANRETHSQLLDMVQRPDS